MLLSALRRNTEKFGDIKRSCERMFITALLLIAKQCISKCVLSFQSLKDQNKQFALERRSVTSVFIDLQHFYKLPNGVCKRWAAKNSPVFIVRKR